MSSASPSWPFPRPGLHACPLHQVTAEPGDGGRLNSYIPRAEAALSWGTCSLAWGSLLKPNLAASEEERGVNQWGFPCPQVI